MNYFLAGIVSFTVLVVGALMLMAFKARRRLEVEEGKTPLYRTTAGGLIGRLRYRGPFISLRVYDEFIVIGCTRTIVLRFAEIDRVEITKWMGMVSDGIQLIHHNSDAPDKIIIGATNPAEVKELIDLKLQERKQSV